MNQNDQNKLVEELTEKAKEDFRAFNYHLTVAAEKCMNELAMHGEAFIYIGRDLKPKHMSLEDIKNKYELKNQSSLIIGV